MIERFASKLHEALQQPLPGAKAHEQMTSYKRPDAVKAATTEKNLRYGSVLVPFYPHRGEIFVSLMLRPKYQGVHSAQVSFPGGRQEGEETPEECALRESHEELGIVPQRVKLIGLLSPVFIPPSRFFVTPHVGIINERPNFQTDPFEVERLIEVSAETLFDDSIESIREIDLPHLGTRIKTPCFLVNDLVVWGATAMMISEIKAIYKGIQTELK